MSVNEYFRALTVEMPPARDIAQAVVGGALIPSPYWMSLLQEVNLLLAIGTGVGGFILTWAAVYRLVKHYHSK